jgi:hypothetical protein
MGTNAQRLNGWVLLLAGALSLPLHACGSGADPQALRQATATISMRQAAALDQNNSSHSTGTQPVGVFFAAAATVPGSSDTYICGGVTHGTAGYSSNACATLASDGLTWTTDYNRSYMDIPPSTGRAGFAMFARPDNTNPWSTTKLIALGGWTGNPISQAGTVATIDQWDTANPTAGWTNLGKLPIPDSSNTVNGITQSSGAQTFYTDDYASNAYYGIACGGVAHSSTVAPGTPYFMNNNGNNLSNYPIATNTCVVFNGTDGQVFDTYMPIATSTVPPFCTKDNDCPGNNQICLNSNCSPVQTYSTGRIPTIVMLDNSLNQTVALFGRRHQNDNNIWESENQAYVYSPALQTSGDPKRLQSGAGGTWASSVPYPGYDGVECSAATALADCVGFEGDNHCNSLGHCAVTGGSCDSDAACVGCGNVVANRCDGSGEGINDYLHCPVSNASCGAVNQGVTQAWAVVTSDYKVLFGGGTFRRQDGSQSHSKYSIGLFDPSLVGTGNEWTIFHGKGQRMRQARSRATAAKIGNDVFWVAGGRSSFDLPSTEDVTYSPAHGENPATVGTTYDISLGYYVSSIGNTLVSNTGGWFSKVVPLNNGNIAYLGGVELTDNNCGYAATSCTNSGSPYYMQTYGAF